MKSFLKHISVITLVTFIHFAIMSPASSGAAQDRTRSAARIPATSAAAAAASRVSQPEPEEEEPADINAFALLIDNNLRKKNVYYDDLISGNILQPSKITMVRKNGFVDYMKSIGKLGGQNKVPRLSNDRKIADGLEEYCL